MKINPFHELHTLTLFENKIVRIKALEDWVRRYVKEYGISYSISALLDPSEVKAHEEHQKRACGAKAGVDIFESIVDWEQKQLPKPQDRYFKEYYTRLFMITSNHRKDLSDSSSVS